jgi:hypothetical protein
MLTDVVWQRLGHNLCFAVMYHPGCYSIPSSSSPVPGNQQETPHVGKPTEHSTHSSPHKPKNPYPHTQNTMGLSHQRRHPTRGDQVDRDEAHSGNSHHRIIEGKPGNPTPVTNPGARHSRDARGSVHGAKDGGWVCCKCGGKKGSSNTKCWSCTESRCSSCEEYT